MGILEILVLAVGLSLDSLAVSLSLGVLCNRYTSNQKWRFLIIIGLSHVLMTLTGWLLGDNLRHFVAAFDHWVAFGLLLFLGIRMIREAIFKKENDNPCCDLLSLRNTLLFGVALSIDALVTGFSLGMVNLAVVNASPLTNIIVSALVVGCTAFIISFLGFLIGKRGGAKLGNWTEILGGLILIGIGTKVLLEHICCA